MDSELIYRKIFYATLKLRREWCLPYLRELEASQFLTRKELEARQLKRLNHLLSFAVDHAGYYKTGFPSVVSSLSEVSDLPLIEKDAIRSNGKAFMTTGGVHQRLKTSGGPTGAPVTLLKDSRGMAQELAATWRGYGWAGVKIGIVRRAFGVCHVAQKTGSAPT